MPLIVSQPDPENDPGPIDYDGFILVGFVVLVLTLAFIVGDTHMLGILK